MNDARDALLASLVPSFELAEVNGACVVEAAGELDLSAADELDATLAEARERSRSVVLDLTDVSFIDSNSLGRLLAFDRQLASGGGAFALVVRGAEVGRALELTRLDRILTTVPTRGAAVAAVTRRSR